MARAAARDPAWDDLAALGDEAPQPTHVLVIDEVDLVRAELANLPPSEPAALHGLLNRRNCSAPLYCRTRTSIRTGRRRRCRALRPRTRARPRPPRATPPALPWSDS